MCGTNGGERGWGTCRYHPKCLGMLDEDAAAVSRTFYCDTCVKQNKALSLKTEVPEQPHPSSTSQVLPITLDDDDEYALLCSSPAPFRTLNLP